MNYPLNRMRVGHADSLYSLLAGNSISLGEYTKYNPDHPYPFLLKQSFSTAARQFKTINSVSMSVLVHYENSESIIHELCGAWGFEKQFKLIKSARRFSVNLFPWQFRKLSDLGAIHETQKEMGVFYLNQEYYDPEIGVTSDEILTFENLII
jgi:CRISPR-associated endonuclease/helicase Cas3